MIWLRHGVSKSTACDRVIALFTNGGEGEACPTFDDHWRGFPCAYALRKFAYGWRLPGRHLLPAEAAGGRCDARRRLQRSVLRQRRKHDIIKKKGVAPAGGSALQPPRQSSAG